MAVIGAILGDISGSQQEFEDVEGEIRIHANRLWKSACFFDIIRLFGYNIYYIWQNH